MTRECVSATGLSAVRIRESERKEGSNPLFGQANHSNIHLHTGANNNHIALPAVQLDQLQEWTTAAINAGTTVFSSLYPPASHIA
jgi:hypothetical protein